MLAESKRESEGIDRTLAGNDMNGIKASGAETNGTKVLNGNKPTK